MRVCFECQRCFDDSELYCTEENHPALSQDRDGSPEMVPGYRLAFLLESGLKGETYRAHQLASGGTCLIRIVAADDAMVRPFLVDADRTAAFFHPNVVDVYETGYVDSGELFVVSEDAEGRTLRSLLDSGVPDVVTTVQVVRQVAEALEALHKHGLTHGAINPENIILTTDDHNGSLARIKDVDYGGAISRAVISNKFLSGADLEMLKYFSPEQCGGTQANDKSDIYALGIILHEMLAGSPPFNATKAVGLIEQHKNQPPPAIRIDSFDLRMLLTHTLTEALRKQPETRQHSANAFARQMRHMEQLATHTSTPPPAGAASTLTSTPAPDFSATTFVHPTPEIFPAEPPLESWQRADDDYAPVTETPQHVYDVYTPAEYVIDDPAPVPVIRVESVKHVEPAKLGLLVDDDVADRVVEPKPSKPRFQLKALKEKLLSLAPSKESPAVGSPRIFDDAKKELERLKAEYGAGTAKGTALTASATPKKVQWELPEDDIPSQDAVLQAMGLESIEQMPFVQEEAAVPIRARTIEWEQPEDDIPSEAAVLETMGLDEMPYVHKEPAAQVHARAIEWEQPEDDIPSEAAALEAMGLDEMPFVQEESPVQVHARTIEWEQPEDDIPSQADALQALGMEPVAESAVINAPEPAPMQFEIIEWQAPKDEVPAMVMAEAPLVEPAVEISPSIPEPIPSAADAGATVFEWKEPEDYIPSEAAILKAISKGLITEMSAGDPEPVAAAVVAVPAVVVESEPLIAASVEVAPDPVQTAETPANARRRSRLRRAKEKAMAQPAQLEAAVEDAAETKAPPRSRLTEQKKRLRSMTVAARKMLVRDPITEAQTCLEVEPASAEPPVVHMEPAVAAEAPDTSMAVQKKRKRSKSKVTPKTEVLTASSPKPIAETPVEPAKRSKAEASLDQFKPTLIEWAPIEDIPAIKDAPVSGVRAAEIPAAEIEPEEITLVRSESSRIRVDLDEARVPQIFVGGKYGRTNSSRTAGPSPSTRRRAVKRKSGDRAEQMFSSYAAPDSAEPSRARYRAAIGAGCVIIIAALLVLSRVIISDHVSTEVASSPATSSTLPVHVAPPQSVRLEPVSPATQMALKKVETTIATDKVERAAEVEKTAEKDSGSGSSKQAPDKAGTTVAAEKEKDPPPVAAKVKSHAPKASLVSQNSQTVPSATSSTLVISYGNGKVRSTIIDPVKKSSGKKPASKAKDVTRPRIVRNPDPDSD